MIFQSIFLERIIVFSISQIWPIIYCPIFTYKLLSRNINRSTLILSAYFILNTILYIIAFLSLLLIETPYSKPLYLISYYLFTFSHIWLIVLTWILVRLPEKIHSYKLSLIIIANALLSSYVFWIGINFDGISYGPETGWRPEFSWSFLSISWIYVFFFLLIPQIILSRKVLQGLKDESMKRRIKMFTISVYFDLIDVFMLILYNTWVDNPVYRTVHLFIALPLTTTAAFLTYLSFGKDYK